MKKIAFLFSLFSLFPSLSANEPYLWDLHGVKIFVEGEYLHWKPSQNGMNYTVSFTSLDVLLGAQNEVILQNSNWGSGFRLGAGLDFFQNDSDITFRWTHFHHTSRNSNFNSFLLANQLLSQNTPFVVGGSGIPGAGPARSEWRLRLDLYELDFGFRLYGNRSFIHPYIGVIGGQINQTQTIHYDNFLDTSNSVFLNATILQRNDFHGVGPKLGIDGAVKIWRDLELIGNGSTSFLIGSSRHPVTVTVLDDPVGFPVPITNVLYRKNRGIPILQGQVGLGWATLLCNCITLDLEALYEADYFIGTWRNQSSLINDIFIADAGYNNLITHGLTFKVGFGY